MPLNKQKGNMYGFVTHTFNTVKGICPHQCKYCYMSKWGTLKPVRFDKNELKTNLGNGNVVFVGSSCDMFADQIPSAWIVQTLAHCENYLNDYLFQSKNTKRMHNFSHLLPFHAQIGTTIETNRWYGQIMGNTPRPFERAIWLNHFRGRNFLTIEPIMDFDLPEMMELINIINPKQVNIGADSKNCKLPEPNQEKITRLITEIEKISTVHIKKNLNRLLK